MAEQYEPGLQRIFYRSTSFKTGLTVHVELDRSKFDVDTVSIPLEEISNKMGLYYFDYVFQEGVYLASFFENGVGRGTQVYNIRSSGGFGSSLVRPYLGPSVIG